MSDNIPFDIQMSIMNKLPVKSLLQFRTVSKLWKYCIDSPKFILEYGARGSKTNRFALAYEQGYFGYLYLFDDYFTLNPLNLNIPSFPRSFDLNNYPYLDLTTVGTSQGVWCFQSFYRVVLIWNTSLRKSVWITVPSPLRGQQGRKYFIGFGVAPEDLEATVLHFSLPAKGHGRWIVYFFSMTTKQWMPIQQQNMPRENIRLKRSSQSVIGRYIFWVGSETFNQGEDDGNSYKRFLIMSFDMVTQTFQEIQIPDTIIVHLPIPFKLCEHRDAIVIYGNILADVNNVFCVTVLEVDGASLTGRILTNFTHQSQCSLKLLGFTDAEEPIVEVDTPFQSEHTLEVYQHWSRQFHNVCIEGDAGSFFMASYKESLILLNEHDGSIY